MKRGDGKSGLGLLMSLQLFCKFSGSDSHLQIALIVLRISLKPASLDECRTTGVMILPDWRVFCSSKFTRARYFW